jgi:rubrerythrin
VTLATFGAILSYALELERDAAGFYEERASASPDDLAAAMAAACARRINRLERLRREGVSEMILESIHGFDEKAFPLIRHLDQAGQAWRWRAAEAEQRRQLFFETAAAKIPIREVSRQFVRMAQENGEALELLRQADDLA